MKIKYLAVVAAVFMFTVSAMAKKVDLGFQVGEVVNAETSTVDTRILSWEDSPDNKNYRSKRYVVVVMKMRPMRQLNIVDYTLTLNGVTEPCAAVASNMNVFVNSSQSVQFTEKDYARMIFVFDAARVRGNGKIMSARLNSKVSGRRTVAFNVTDLGNKPFTDISKIPAAGLLK